MSVNSCRFSNIRDREQRREIEQEIEESREREGKMERRKRKGAKD